MPRARYSLMMSFCVVPVSDERGAPCSSRDRDIEREQPCRRRVYRHRRVHLVERDSSNSARMSPICVTGTPTLADFALGQRIVAVVIRSGSADRRRWRGPRLPLRQIGAIERVRGCRARMAGVGPEISRGLSRAMPTLARFSLQRNMAAGAKPMLSWGTVRREISL